MAVPQIGFTPSTPFLTQLSSKGFSSWYTFDFTEPKAFFKALGCGVISHFGMTYKKVQAYYERTIIPRMQSLMVVEQNYAKFGGQRFEREEFWRDLGLACSQLCINHFITVGKKEQAEIVRKGGCPDKENSLAYKAMAKFFSLCIVYYEQTTSGIITHMFYDDEKQNEISLFVNLGQDSGRLYLLFHCDFTFTTTVSEPRFPFYMLNGYSEGPIIIGDKKSGQAGAVAVTEGLGDLVKKLVGVVEAQAKVLERECRFLTLESVPMHNDLKEKVKQATVLIKALNCEVSLDSSAIKTVLNLQANKEASAPERPPHTILTCFQYPELGKLLSFHFHSFHSDCLATYIYGLSLQFPQKPKCPLCADGTELPDNALDVCPEILQAYAVQKNISCDMKKGHANTYTAIESGSPAYSATSQTIPSSPSDLCACLYCGIGFTLEHFLTHGCYLCVACGLKACYSNNNLCYICNWPFPQNDFDAIQYYELQLTWYYQQQGYESG